TTTTWAARAGSGSFRTGGGPKRGGVGGIWPPVSITHRSRCIPRPPVPMRATLMRSFAPRTRAWAWAVVARPRTPSAAPAPTADFTNSRLFISETHLDAELDVALVGLGQHPAEGGVAWVDADSAVGGAGKAAVVGITEVGMVREVEELGPELQPTLAAHRDALEESDVPVGEPGAAQDVASGVAERARGRRRERGGVE